MSKTKWSFLIVLLLAGFQTAAAQTHNIQVDFK